MRTGIFGGTFDPPHCGHLIIAEHVRERLKLDRIIFMPACIPPHKQRLDIAPAAARHEMLKLAVVGNPSFSVSDIEIRRGGISFTVDSLRDLRMQYPGDEYFLMIGMDNLREFGTWKEPDMILRMAQVVVMSRPGFSMTGVDRRLSGHVTLCDVPEIEIASRVIRGRIRAGQSIKYLVPAVVEEFIASRGLYQPAE